MLQRGDQGWVGAFPRGGQPHGTAQDGHRPVRTARIQQADRLSVESEEVVGIVEADARCQSTQRTVTVSPGFGTASAFFKDHRQ